MFVSQQPLPIMSNKVVIITGANSGIGYRTAEMLCQRGLEVILACRNETRGLNAVQKLRAELPTAKVSFMKLDLSRLQSVKEFADEFLASGKSLHILVNNAAVAAGTSKTRPLTADGYELHMGTNHIAHFLLTSLLLPKLKDTGNTTGQNSRIVVVSSAVHDKDTAPRLAGKNQAINLQDVNLEIQGAYNSQQAYKNSKLANVLFTLYLAKKLLHDGDKVIVNCMDPGLMPDTNLKRNLPTLARCCFSCVTKCLCRACVGNIVRSVDHGAGMIVDLALNPIHEQTSGKYFADYTEEQAALEARIQVNQTLMWQITKELIREKYPDMELME